MWACHLDGTDEILFSMSRDSHVADIRDSQQPFCPVAQTLESEGHIRGSRAKIPSIYQQTVPGMT